LVLEIARAGLSPSGQVLVQFMMVAAIKPERVLEPVETLASPLIAAVACQVR
jgi:hypothetical protein